MTVRIKKEILIAIIGVLILLNGFVLFTVWRIHPIGGHGPIPHLDHDREHRESMLFLHHELDLDEEQVSHLGEIRQQHFDRTRPHMDRIHALRSEITKAVLQDTPDLERIRQLAEELGKIQTEIEYERVIHFSELRGIIAPEQRKKFDQLMEDLLERIHGPMEELGMERHFPVPMPMSECDHSN